MSQGGQGEKGPEEEVCTVRKLVHTEHDTKSIKRDSNTQRVPLKTITHLLVLINLDSH